MKTVAFHTLGCKLNFSETSTIKRQLIASGLIESSFNEGADLFIINTSIAFNINIHSLLIFFKSILSILC